jgi:hypothetical protein
MNARTGRTEFCEFLTGFSLSETGRMVMTHYLLRLSSAAVLSMIPQFAATGQNGAVPLPSIPENLKVPSGNIAYLKAYAVGTQNYVCTQGAAGAVWKFLGPQATLFLTFPWINGEGRQQIATHFLSSNPADGGKSGPTWQHSLDTSAVWGKVMANSTDPAYVAPGAIPWLLLQVAGSQKGPMGGSFLLQTTYIQRLNTSGGTAPSSGCDESAYGTFLLVPYTTDYFFYKAAN